MEKDAFAHEPDRPVCTTPGTPGKGGRFQTLPRFIEDGVSSVPNFLKSGGIGEGRESSPTARTNADKSAQNVFSNQLGALPNFLDEINKSLCGKAALVSTSSRVDSSSLQFKDPRYLALQPPYSTGLGPGSYDTEGGSPSIGPLSPDSPLRSCTPGRDPLRANSPFKSPPRCPLFRMGEYSGMTSYLNSSYKGLSDKAPRLYASPLRRPEVSDYRYSTLHSEARKAAPAEVPDAALIDSCGRSVSVAGRVGSTKSAVVPFMSKLPRFAQSTKDSLASSKPAQHQLIVKLQRITPGPLDPSSPSSCPSSPSASFIATYVQYNQPLARRSDSAAGDFDRQGGHPGSPHSPKGAHPHSPRAYTSHSRSSAVH